jgi:hypothetical protein
LQEDTHTKPRSREGCQKRLGRIVRYDTSSHTSSVAVLS